MKIKYSILAFLLLYSGVLFAQNVKITAQASTTTAATGEVFEVTFNIIESGGSFSPPNFRGFQEVGQSSSSYIDNNSSSTTVKYQLVPLSVGDFTIDPAVVVANGKRFSSNVLKIKVIKGKPVPQNAQQQSAPDNAVSNRDLKDLTKVVFMRAVVDKSTVYQGEQIILNYRIYSRLGIEQIAPNKLPELNGFWSEEIKANQQQQVRDEVYKGVRYRVLDLKQAILFPEHAGDLTIDPFGAIFYVDVPVQSDDPMDQFFGSVNQVKYQAKSAPLTIHVKPLPQAGKPDSFTGAVGDFNMEASVDKTELKANEALNYKVKVSGYGNIKLLKSLGTAFPADFEKYDPKISDSVNDDESGVSGYRFYNYLLIPRHQGDYTIDPLKFSYFNPISNKYITVTSKGFHIKVDKGTSESNVTELNEADKQDIKMLSKDIRYIKTSNADLDKSDDAFYGSVGYYLLLLFGPLLCCGAYAYRNWLIKTNSDAVKVKSRKAGKVAAKHLANAEKQLLANNKQAFYENISTGLYGYLTDKLNIQYANLDRETIISALKGKSVSDKVVGQLLDTLDLCEMARYAPVQNISEKEVFEKAKGIINDIENEI